MKKNTKGFTLIELLAVIVILAIIALIATPIVLNLIERARKGAAQDSAIGVRQAAKNYYLSALVENPDQVTEDITISFSADKVTISKELTGAAYELDGTKPTAGKITISTKGEVSGTVKISGFGCVIKDTGSVSCSRDTVVS